MNKQRLCIFLVVSLLLPLFFSITGSEVYSESNGHTVSAGIRFVDGKETNRGIKQKKTTSEKTKNSYKDQSNSSMPKTNEKSSKKFLFYGISNVIGVCFFLIKKKCKLNLGRSHHPL
ncbi:hypothetical protein MT881_002544 [Enterococcus faecium]|nr:hypothetical protein [Enterococcus faecium]